MTAPDDLSPVVDDEVEADPSATAVDADASAEGVSSAEAGGTAEAASGADAGTSLAGGAPETDGVTTPAKKVRGIGTDLERESEIAADYLEDLLDIADLDGDIDMDVERDRAMVSVVGGDLGDLVGPDGTVLEALQELTRLAVLTQTGQRSRLMLDIGGYRAGRRTVLSELGRQTVETVKTTGEKVRLEPMSPFERKIVHDAVAEGGLTSESEGEEPRRRVVVLPG